MINNIIESVRNTDGRFRTLSRIYPLHMDEPVVFAGPGYCDLDMVLEREPVRMRCLIRRDQQLRERLGAVSSFFSAIEEPLYNRFLYLDNELLVFDDTGGYTYMDIFLEWKPKGKPLTKWRNPDAEQLTVLAAQLASFAKRHHGNGLRHGNLTPASIYTVNGDKPVIAGFAKASRGDACGDVVQLARICCVLGLAVADPRAVGLLGEEGVHCEKLASVNMGQGIPAALADALAVALDPQEGDSYVLGLLDALATIPFRDIRADALFTEWLDGNGVAAVRADPPARPRKPKYITIGEPVENMMRAFDGKGWCFIDKDGNVAIKGPFVNVDDFAEGLAKVEVTDGFGVVNREGRYILDPVYDDIEMDNDANRIIVTLDGLSGIANREGQWLTPICYDDIRSCSDGLFLVEKDRKFGFVSRDGRNVTGMKYDAARSFKNGVATVSYKGKKIVIDTEGEIIADVLE